MYCNPEIESSYHINDIGQTIYDYIIKEKPMTVVEFGCLFGYSTVTIAMALRDIGCNGKLYCYDLWDEYPYKHSTIETTKSNLKKYQLENYVKFIKMDFYEWLKDPIEFDIMHLDISNNGKTIQDAYLNLKNKINNGSIILFEGGSIERDEVEWMLKYDYPPINGIKHIVDYEILNSKFPSLSVIRK
jgi:predicted O-methyltransferase YrrM